jgi:hypothetical protein
MDRRTLLANAGLAAAAPAALHAPAPRDTQRRQRCLALARQQLLVDPDGTDLAARYARVLLRDGLPGSVPRSGSSSSAPASPA